MVHTWPRLDETAGQHWLAPMPDRKFLSGMSAASLSLADALLASRIAASARQAIPAGDLLTGRTIAVVVMDVRI